MLEFNLTLPVMMVLFLVFAWLMNVLFFGPVARVLEERRQYVAKQQELAQTARGQLEGLQADYDARLKAAHAQAQDVIQTAIKEAGAKRQALLDAVKTDVDQEVATARGSIQSERSAAVASLQSEVGSFTELIKRKVLAGAPAYTSAGGSES